MALLSPKAIDESIREFAESRVVDSATTIRKLTALIESKGLSNVSELLKLLFRYKGLPYSLDNHFPFEPLFNTAMVPYMLLVAGRQVGKSTGLASSSTSRAIIIPNFRQLIVTPLHDQICRLSKDFFRPLIESSPIHSAIVDKTCTSNLMSKTFTNKSALSFNFASLDVDRIRGDSADLVGVDELQDMDEEHLPVIHEVLSHSPWEMKINSGTPKTLDNTINKEWLTTSMEEWFVFCTHCTTNGHPTENIPSLEYDLLKMIGPWRENIGPKAPAIICKNCRKPLYARNGRWWPRVKALRGKRRGLHIPQLIMPIHNENPRKWESFLAKVNNPNKSPATIANENHGESIDVGQKLLTETDIKKACTLNIKNNPYELRPDIIARAKRYEYTCLGIDWGGGGAKETSWTTVSLCCLNNGRVDVIWGRRLPNPNDHLGEAEEVHKIFRILNPDFIAHDYTGAGELRETILASPGSGLPPHRLVPISLIRPAKGALFEAIPPTSQHPRAHYRMDKSRTLGIMVAAIRRGYIRFFDYDKVNAEDAGLLSDFLNLVEEKKRSFSASDVYGITNSTGTTDDFAHAVNFGCSALWHFHKCWPDIATDIRGDVRYKRPTQDELLRLKDSAASAP